MILFVHTTLLRALPDIIGGFSTGGFSGGISSIGQAILAPRKQRAAATRAVRSMKAERTRVGNIPGFSVASLGTNTEPVGGATFRPTFVPQVQAPSFSSLGNVQLGPTPVGFGSMAGPIARGLRQGFTSTEQFDRTVRRTRVGVGLGGLAAGAAFQPTGGGVREAVQAAGRRLDPRRAPSPTGGFRMRQIPLTRGGGPMARDLAIRPAGLNGGSNFAKDECGNVLKFFCSPRPGEGWIDVRDAASVGLRPTKPFARFNLMTEMFVRMPRRRMNPLNIKALGRAVRRKSDFLDIVLPMIKERRAEKSGRRPFIRAGARRGKKRRKKARC